MHASRRISGKGFKEASLTFSFLLDSFRKHGCVSELPTKSEIMVIRLL